MIEAQELRKTYRAQPSEAPALDGVTFRVKSGSFFTLLGPSGCGKTTTLRCVAGLERPDQGEIAIGGRLVFSAAKKISVPGNQRDVGMVFQSYAIWPHMTVFENVAFPLRVRGNPHGSIRKQVLDVLELVGLAGLEGRRATQLSGGQQQRVALARALAAKPQLLLLDEPLSNLDAKLRNQMRRELKELQSRLQTTTLYVTHDQAEALAISDEIALMNRGRIIQIGTPREIYRSPVNEFSADFIGAANIVPGRLIEGPDQNGWSRVETPLGDFRATQKWRMEDGRVGENVLIAFRPESVLIAAGPFSQDHNILKGEIQSLTYLGESTEFHVAVGPRKLLAKAGPGLEWEKGRAVYLHIPADSCLVIRHGEL
jgi:iron(III) transport system ATP-binding protein